MTRHSVLDIIAHGAWNGGIPLDNSIYEDKGMFFKGGKPVNDETIQERIGVRTRIAERHLGPHCAPAGATGAGGGIAGGNAQDGDCLALCRRPHPRT
ncbi:MAG: hypothetical protein SV375_12645, partial [Thermodesulfobacteriota bacterium]|nr:hypothetical protein [Thermodesulfobacteriota bacterium]